MSIPTLRPYQSRAVAELRDAYRHGSRAPLLVLPTGGGKTVVFSHVAHGASARGHHVLVLVHRRELIRQASSKLGQLGVDHGIIAAGFAGSAQPVQVASVQTLARRLGRTDWAPDLIVIDEAHHAVAGTWSKVLEHWPAALRLGVTATPVRQDGRGLSTMFDRLVQGPTVRDLTAQGFLSPARIYAPPVKADLTKLQKRAGDYQSDEASRRMDRPTVTGDAISHYQRLCQGAPAIAFCCSAQHATHVSDQFRQSGIRSAVILGTTPVDEREAMIRDLGRGALQVLVSVDVVSEGTDIPAVTAAILLRPTMSEGLYLQQVGRVLRPAPGKAEAIILDHVGNVITHGFPDDDRHWSLDGREEGTGQLETEKAPIVRQCGVCFAAFPPQPVCPVCGTPSQLSVREIQQREGELQELQREQLRREQRRQVGSARTLDELMAVAKQRGYHPNWARRLHAARHRHG